MPFANGRERHRCGYLLTVASNQHLGLRPVTEWIVGLGDADWQRLSAGDGAKGPRWCDRACRPYPGAAKGFRCGLLARRSVADPSDVTFYLTHAPEATTLDELVKIAGSRWSIESLFVQSKGEVGFDNTKSAPGRDGIAISPSPRWPLPISSPSERTLSGGVDLKDQDLDLLPLTVPEIRHLLADIVARPYLDREQLLRWSEWRRRHQQRPRRASDTPSLEAA